MDLQVNTAGSIQVSRHTYYVDAALVRVFVLVHLDASYVCFYISFKGVVLCIVSTKLYTLTK